MNIQWIAAISGGTVITIIQLYLYLRGRNGLEKIKNYSKNKVESPEFIVTHGDQKRTLYREVEV